MKPIESNIKSLLAEKLID